MSASVALVQPAAISFPPGQRIMYTSVTTGNEYAGYVVDMYTDGGCQLRLDVDGGVKDLDAADLVRVKAVEGITAAPSTYTLGAQPYVTYAGAPVTTIGGSVSAAPAPSYVYPTGTTLTSLGMQTGTLVGEPVPVAGSVIAPAATPDAAPVATTAAAPVLKKKKKSSKKSKGCC